MREMPPRHFECVDEMKVVLRIYVFFLSYAIICRVLLYDTLVCLDQERFCDNRRTVLGELSMELETRARRPVADHPD